MVREILAEKRPERLVFPRLHVARRPVVEQTKSENMRGCLADRHGFAERRRRADIHAELELEIHVARWPVARRLLVLPFALALRALHRRAADAHRRGAAVIGDRHVFVVRQQRIVGAEGAAGIGGVKDRRIEIGEVADRDRQQHFGLRHRASNAGVRLLSPRSALRARDKESRSADQACGPSAISALRFGAAQAFAAVAASPLERRRCRRDVEDLIADRHADSRTCVRRRPKHAERQVLNRKIAVGRVCRLDKASPGGIVCLVGRGHAAMS